MCLFNLIIHQEASHEVVKDLKLNWLITRQPMNRKLLPTLINHIPNIMNSHNLAAFLKVRLDMLTSYSLFFRLFRKYLVIKYLNIFSLEMLLGKTMSKEFTVFYRAVLIMVYFFHYFFDLFVVGDYYV